MSDVRQIAEKFGMALESDHRHPVEIIKENKALAKEVEALRSTLAELVGAADWITKHDKKRCTCGASACDGNTMIDVTALIEVEAKVAAAKSLLDDSKGEA